MSHECPCPQGGRGGATSVPVQSFGAPWRARRATASPRSDPARPPGVVGVGMETLDLERVNPKVGFKRDFVTLNPGCQRHGPTRRGARNRDPQAN